MRYYWGFGVGHIYAHQQRHPSPTVQDVCDSNHSEGDESDTDRPLPETNMTIRERGSPPSSDSSDTEDDLICNDGSESGVDESDDSLPATDDEL